MENDKNSTTHSQQQPEDKQTDNQKPLTVHNPFDPNDKRQITQEDIENEQKFKEALSERD